MSWVRRTWEESGGRKGWVGASRVRRTSTTALMVRKRSAPPTAPEAVWLTEDFNPQRATSTADTQTSAEHCAVLSLS